MRSIPLCRRELSGLFACGILVALLAQARAATDETNPGDPSAQEILDRMAKVYAECKSYRDSGVVKTLFLEGNNGRRTVNKSFTTAFVRPGRFRFEFQEELSKKDRYIIWTDGKEVLTWWYVNPGIQKKESIDLAIAAAAGVSGGSSKTISSLLQPDMESWRRLTEIKEPKRIEDAKLREIECFRVEGVTADHPITLWICKTSFLVRQIDEKDKFDTFRTETTTTYDPTLDGEITDEMLKFDPPAKK